MCVCARKRKREFVCLYVCDGWQRIGGHLAGDVWVCMCGCVCVGVYVWVCLSLCVRVCLRVGRWVRMCVYVCAGRGAAVKWGQALGACTCLCVCVCVCVCVCF